MTMNVNKKLAAQVMAVAMAAASWGAMAAAANVEMNGEVIQTTCTLDSTSENIVVDLGRPSTGDFAGRAAGYSASEGSFNVGLTGCEGVTGLTVWASGAQPEPGLANSIRNTLTSGATGVAMQLFSNLDGHADTLMNPNSDASSALALTVPDSDTHTLPFTAKMVKVATDTPVTAGLVQGHVTLNVGYQ